MQLVLAALAAGLGVSTAFGQQGAADGEWRHHGGGNGSSRYSGLSQIDAANFSQLEVAWGWESADLRIEESSPYKRQPFRATPLMIGGRLYVQSRTAPGAMALTQPDPARSDWKYVNSGVRAAGPRGLPLVKPPYRRITAVDLKMGDLTWQAPLGQGPTGHPAIKHLELGPLGGRGSSGVDEGGLLITRTLLITFAAKLDELGNRLRDGMGGAYLQAYDKATGKLLAEVEVDRSLHSSPMTYLHQGRQYIVVAGGGVTEKAELVAFAVP